MEDSSVQPSSVDVAEDATALEMLLLLELGAAVVVALVIPVALVMEAELKIVEDGIPELVLAVALGAKEELVLRMEVVECADDDATLLLLAGDDEEVA